jgi:hypothetical protein
VNVDDGGSGVQGAASLSCESYDSRRKLPPRA